MRQVDRRRYLLGEGRTGSGAWRGVIFLMCRRQGVVFLARTRFFSTTGGTLAMVDGNPR